ncbi:nucleoside recognition domain-containing protein [Bacillus sp. 165]|uniref:nucleoside recognition domain-containing protein n=1 Tax=Bacillus sp. 165 TaxID=1529117 RepID=UPI0032AF05CD
MGTLKKGLLSGLKTTWLLGKIIVPVTLIVTVLKYTPILPWVTQFIEPLMQLIGLPGDAAVPLVLGNFLNLYAAIGAIITLKLSVKEVFILAVMLSFSHNLLVETSVASRVGIRTLLVLGVRLGLAIVSAIVIHFFWDGGKEAAEYGLVSAADTHLQGWSNIILHAMENAAFGVLQLAMIAIPLMVGIQFLKDYGFLAVFSKWMSPFTRMLGMKENTSTTLAAGLFFGLAFGAGVMIQAVKEDGVEKRDLVLAFIFLIACHAVIEDTLIFVPLGIPVLPLLLIRLIVAVLLTVMVSVVWRNKDIHQRKELVHEN